MDGLPIITYSAMAIAFLPSVGVILIMQAWRLEPGQAIWANLRMLGQLLAVGYVLTFIFETENPWIVVGVVTLMMLAAAWIALRPLEARTPRKYVIALGAIGSAGLLMLALVTQLTLELPRWFEPRFVVPIAGMIFANAMNTVSLAAERFESERNNGAATRRCAQHGHDGSPHPADQRAPGRGARLLTRHDDRADPVGGGAAGGRALSDRSDVHDLRIIRTCGCRLSDSNSKTGGNVPGDRDGDRNKERYR